MVPPPDNTGDEFPDFEKMTFEEQMAWLESLAKRQGAGADELTTAADLDIPVPENADIDEPGYIPFEGSRSAREMQAAAAAASQQAEKEPVPLPTEEARFIEELPEELADEVLQIADEPVLDAMGEGDPMQWLDSLAVQPSDGEDVSEIMDALFDDESEEGDLDLFAEADEIEEAPVAMDELDEIDEMDAVAEVGSVKAAHPAVSDDPLGGMDPMLWLESLAARQGANLSELTTSADLQIDDVPEGIEIDEPGYVPFEGSRSAREATMAASHGEALPGAEIEDEEELPELFAEEEELEVEFDLDDVFGAEEVAEPEAEEEEDLLELFAEEEEPEVQFDLDDVFGTDEVEEPGAVAADALFDDGADSMAWLESLAKRQGARDEELLTPADLDVPEMPADTIVDEPGYVEYSPLSILPPDQLYDATEVGDELADVAAFDEAADGGLSWLEDLAAEHDEDVAEFLAFEDEVVARHAADAEAEPVESAEAVAGVSDDPLAGMSDEDIARAQAQGTLTPHQELAWLKRQARALADTREAEEMAGLDQEVPPAEPGELPDWLETIRQTAEEEVMSLSEGVLDEVPVVASGALPDWLQEPDEDAAAKDEFVEVSLDGDVESLWGEEVAETAAPDLDQLIPDSELAAFISGEYAPSESDALAEALDEEYERIQSGDDSEPEWYTAAVEKVAADELDFLEVEAEEEISAEPILAEAEPVESPGWLDELVEEDELPEVVVADVGDDDDDMPTWLRSVDEAATVARRDDDMPDWLADEVEEPVAAAADSMPDWLAGVSEEMETPDLQFMADAEEVPVAEEPQVVPPVVPVVPEKPAAPALPVGEVYEQFRERLEREPGAHSVRLALARALHSNRNVDSALEQYEVLIEAAELLPDVSGDLSAVVAEQPEQPRAQRLLGDAFMRRGMLSEALDAYRNALRQL